ncbi:MAG: hypothetical protein JWN72_1348, partial [Thermoleophilia bacterium]|nr:hypothetical protein [Thermoleophilia bacterium]
ERSARRSTEQAARGVVQPALTASLVAGDPAARQEFDRLVRTRVLDSTTVRVKLWNSEGRIIYADRSALVGSTFELDDEELEILREGGTASEITDLDQPENRADRHFGRLLEVYTRVEAPDGTPLMFETYVRDASVSSSGRALWARILPPAIGALLLLELLQAPLAWLLARRLGARRREREALLQAAVDAGELERRRIARDLHDGVVQRLMGLGMHLHATALEAPASTSGDVTEALASAAGQVRQSVRELRTLLVDIYPPNLRDVGLEAALADLISELPARGIEPRLTFGLARPLTATDERLLYRVAQEAVRNAERHSRAATLELTVAPHARRGVLLRVVDDGAGFDTAAPAGDGHVGLVLLRDLVASAGGTMHIRSAPGEGTVVELHLETSDA